MPLDRKVIEEQLAAIGEGDRWWDQPEMRHLPEILASDETVLAMVTGKLKARLRSGRPWLIVVTSVRVVCIRGGEKFGRRQLDIPLKQITTLAHKTGVFRASVTIGTSLRRDRIIVKRGDALKFIAALSAMVNRITPAPFVPGLPAPAVDYVTRAEFEKVFDRIEMLEDEIDRMQKQVDFMEDLLKRRMQLPMLESADTTTS